MAKKRSKTQTQVDDLVEDLITAREVDFAQAEECMGDFRVFFEGIRGRRQKLELKTIASILDAFSLPDKECETMLWNENQLWHADGRSEFLAWFCERFANQIRALDTDLIREYVEEEIIPESFLGQAGASIGTDDGHAKKQDSQAIVAQNKEIRESERMDVFLDAFEGPLPDIFNSEKVLCLSYSCGVDPVDFSQVEPENYAKWSQGVETIAKRIIEKRPQETRVCGYSPLYIFYLLGQKLEFSTSGLVYCNPQRANDPESKIQMFSFDEETVEEGIEFFIPHPRTESEAGETVVIQFFLDPNHKGETDKLLESVKKDGLNVFKVIQILPLGIKRVDVTEENFSRFLKGMKNVIDDLSIMLKRVCEKKIVALSIFGAGFQAFLVGWLLRRNVTNTVYFYEYFHKEDRYIYVNPVNLVESESSKSVEDCAAFLHITDFHVNAERKTALTAMERYLNDLSIRIRGEDIDLDVIIVTGDLVYKPTVANFEGFEKLFLIFVHSLWDEKEKAGKLVVFVPGNHDVDRCENDIKYSKEDLDKDEERKHNY